MTDRDFWMLIRQALLMFVDAIERGRLKKKPTTAEVRKWAKASYPGSEGIKVENVRLRIAKLEVEE